MCRAGCRGEVWQAQSPRRQLVRRRPFVTFRCEDEQSSHNNENKHLLQAGRVEDRNGHGKESNGTEQMRQDDAITDKPHSCLCQRMESISLNRDCLNSRCADAVIFKPIRHGLEDQCVFGLKPYQRERRDVLATTSFLRPKCSGMPHAPSVRLKNSRR